MEKNSAWKFTPETERQSPTLSAEKIAYMGRLAINPELLGINDPLTHLYRYLESNNKHRTLRDIKIDLETDIAERLPKTPFVNKVEFEFIGTDFISSKDKISMKSMTSTNLKIFKEMASSNPVMVEEFMRAEIEAREVDKLSDWFKTAEINEYLVFESLPMGDQTIAISRIYQKTNPDFIEGIFVSLYNPTIDQFNDLRNQLDISTDKNKTELEILENNYSFYNPNLKNSDDFIDYYVDSYDKTLKNKTNKPHYFGLEADKAIKKQNGILKVKNQPKLTDSYLTMVEKIASSKGITTPELVELTEKIGIKRLKTGDTLTTKMVQILLSETIKKIASVIDMADEKLLEDLNNSDASAGENYDAMAYFSEQASNIGKEYSSNNCPEFIGEQSTETINVSEQDILDQVFNANNKLKNFGEAKVGVCRIKNCPTRGESKWWPKKTIVGGCDICVCCHQLFSKGKSPEKVHREERQKQEKIRKKKEQRTKTTA